MFHDGARVLIVSLLLMFVLSRLVVFSFSFPLIAFCFHSCYVFFVPCQVERDVEELSRRKKELERLLQARIRIGYIWMKDSLTRGSHDCFLLIKYLEVHSPRTATVGIYSSACCFIGIIFCRCRCRCCLHDRKKNVPGTHDAHPVICTGAADADAFRGRNIFHTSVLFLD